MAESKKEPAAGAERERTAGDLARPSRGSRRSLIKVDEAGVPDIMPARASLIDRQLQQAMAEGQFDNLPGQGKPIPRDDNPLAGEWGLAFHVLKNAGFAPPWVEDDKEARKLLEKRDAILARAAAGPTPPLPARRKFDREALEALVVEANKVITRANYEAPTLQQQRRFLSTDEELAKYDEACRR